MRKKIQKTPYYSHKLGDLPKGCRLCVRGEKLVLFITGVCNVGCFYCPLSDSRKSKDVIFANEWDANLINHKLGQEQIDVLVKEAELCNAKGAGITGGDPLLVAERSAEAIRALKKRFGKGFHVHLYTTLKNISAERLSLLYEAGLDEIRFHPAVWDSSNWERINLAKKFGWIIGVEIPAIPKYEEETKKLIDFLEGKIDFLNLNELEISDNNAGSLSARGCKTKGGLSYAIKGSEESALRLMKYCRDKNYGFDVHYCTSKLKDAIQMARRIKRRAKNAARHFDRITEEGMIIRGVIYLKELSPSFSYRKILGSMNGHQKKAAIEKLAGIRRLIIKKLGIRGGSIDVDGIKLRLITSSDIAKKYGNAVKSMGLVPAIVEEYPTADAIETDIEFL